MLCLEESLPLETLDESLESDDEYRCTWTLQRQKGPLWSIIVTTSKTYLLQYLVYSFHLVSSGKCFLPSKIAQCMLLFEKKIITKGLPLRLKTHMKMMTVVTPAMRIILDARVPITALGDSACLLASGKWYILHELTNNICCRWNSNTLKR